MRRLSDQLERWSEEGLISHEQADAIRRAEERRGGEARVSPIAEVLGYLGAALVAIAVFLALDGIWTSLSEAAKAAIFAAAAVVLFVVGAGASRSTDPAGRRLGGFLWFLSAAGVALSLDALHEAAGLSDDTLVLTVGAGAAFYAWGLWRRRPTSLQQVALFAGLLGTLSGTGEASSSPPGGAAGWSFFLLGVAWLELGRRGLVVPTRTAYVVGGRSALLGPEIMWIYDMFEGPRDWPLILGAGVSVGVMLMSTRLKAPILLWLGTIGLFLYIPEGAFSVFGDGTGVVYALFFSGISLLVVALVTFRLKGLVGTS